MTQCASLITISTFARPTQNPWPRFSFPYSSFVQDASGFQVGFCCLCRHTGSCGLRNNAVLREGEKKVEILISCYARGLLLPLLLSKTDVKLNGGRKNIWKSQSSTKVNKHNGHRKKTFNEPTPNVIELNLFTFSV